MNTHHIKRMLTAVLMLISSTQLAFAEIHNSNRYYFGAGISSTSLTIDSANASAIFSGHDEITADENQASLELLFGIKLDEYLTLEFGVADLGKINAINNSQPTQLLSVSNFFIDTSLETKLSENISVFGKVGLSLWNTKLGHAKDSYEEGNGLLYGVGLDLNLYGGSNRKLRFEVKRYDFDSLYLEKADTASMTLMLYF